MTNIPNHYAPKLSVLTQDHVTIAGIDDFPNDLWVVEHPNGKHLVYSWHDAPEMGIVHGLMVLSTVAKAELIRLTLVDLAKQSGDNSEVELFTGMGPKFVTFDEARMIAKSKPPLRAIFLMDTPNEPLVHYVS